ncbi:hypothetical protein DRJ48_00015 [Candidatus Woesearchaeota archaeon]|nr:hypothetical protein [Candidatus Woesearchaeota archaeon]RLE43714.1 MAG: hypothetical protein DRJ48_00015 [Candidatus Woesearchaeota archaeon]
MKRRGQVTVYIIIALIILISFLVLIYLKTGIRGEEGEVSTAVEEVPVTFKPIQQYVEHNLQLALLSAIKNLGQHGGYVDPYTFSPPPNLDNPTEAMALKPFHSSTRIYPYWYYMESPNSCDSHCSFKTLMPPLRSEYKEGDLRPKDDMSIEAQIDRYVKAKLSGLDFTDFKFQNFDVVKLAGPKVTTRIGKDKVYASVVFPLEVSKEGTRVRLSSFKASVPVELEKVYELAGLITKHERDTRFIESFVVNLLGTYSGINKERLPPVGRTVEFGTSPVYWQLDDVRNKVTREVLSKISGISVKGTANFHNTNNQFTGAVVSLGASKFDDIEVYFTFPDTKPFYMAINDLSSGFVGPNTITRNLIFYNFVMNEYAFAYDLSFPVLVTLKLPNGLNNEDYLFQFALEGNIRSNQPLFEGASTLSPDTGHTMLCDEGQELSGDVVIRTNTNEGQPVGDVDLYYHCGGEGCYIGKTDATGVLHTKLPVCIGGLIAPLKQRYIGEPVEFDSYLDKPGLVTLTLDKTKAFKLEVNKLVFEPRETSFGYKWPHELPGFRSLGYTPRIEPLEDDEEVFVVFKRIGTGGLTTYQFPVQVKGSEAELPEVFLAAGDYEVQMMLIKHRELVVPENKCGPLSIGCVPMNETVLNSVQLGGGNLNANTGYFKLPYELMDSDKITLYAVYFNIFSIPQENVKPKDLGVISRLDDYSMYFRKYKPGFS